MVVNSRMHSMKLLMILPSPAHSVFTYERSS
jgi:hypothetical protein